MKLDDMKYEVKGMPDEMRKMVESEVQKQMKVTKKKMSYKKVAVAVLAAAMVVGTTVIAGTQLQKMSIESKGKYGKVTKIQTQSADKTEGNTFADYEIPDVKLTFNYLPEKMVENEGKYSFADTPNRGGISPLVFRMNMGDDAFAVLDTGVLHSENITVGDREGVYLEVTTPDRKDIWMDKKVYVYFPEVHHVLELFIGEDISKEEALKIAEGAELTVTDNEEEAYNTCDWSSYAQMQEENAKADLQEKNKSVQSVLKKNVKGIYKIGDTFSVNSSAKVGTDDVCAGLDVKVSDVKICDDISLLDEKYMGEDFYDETDADGKFLPNKINYIRSGDGVNSVDEIVNMSLSNQKLIYATVEYTNNTDKDLEEVVYFCSTVKAVEDDNSYIMYRRISADGSWDEAIDTSKLICEEMPYYDVRGGSKNNNYIESLKAGETKTVHIGIVVNEDEIPCTFLCMDIQGGEGSFSGAEQTGLVDIRQ